MEVEVLVSPFSNWKLNRFGISLCNSVRLLDSLFFEKNFILLRDFF